MKSPLRYPGGKGALYDYMSKLFYLNGLVGAKYFEPFAGGGGLGLALLSNKLVCSISLNDADYHIYSFWKSILDCNERFITAILNVNVTIDEWYKQKIIYDNSSNYSVFDVGFSCFFLNRCNRSGVISGAGPIGGFKQNGKWLINARFNKNELCKRFKLIGMYKGVINIENKDAIQFLENFVDKDNSRRKCFAYIDPPYVCAGNRLYMNRMSFEDHRVLAEYLLLVKKYGWVLTYDDNDYIKKLYLNKNVRKILLKYSMQNKREGGELMIRSDNLVFP